MKVNRDTQYYHQRYMTKVKHLSAFSKGSLHKPSLEPILGSRPHEENEQHRQEYRDEATLDV
jgi:hypothetical protein